jgi:flavodoxin
MGSWTVILHWRAREVIDVNSIVIYASRYGNTQKIAEVIAGVLHARGAVHLLSTDEAPARLPAGTDLVVIGGPTEVHRMTEPVVRFFERLEPHALQGVAAAGFDTRLRGPRWLSGSAGEGITHKLRRAGAQVIVPEESFFVKKQSNAAQGETPALEPGELERAAAWAAALADKVEASAPAVLGTAT